MSFFENTKMTLEDFFRPKANGIKKCALSHMETEEAWTKSLKDFIKNDGNGSDAGIMVLNVKRGELFFEGKIFKYDRQI